MSKNIIEVKNLTKYYKIKEKRGLIRDLFFPKYKNFLALKDVNFNIKKNEIFGILGPNGAGKTTIVKLLSGLLEPSSGTILIDGKDVSKDFIQIQKKIGTMFGNTMIYYRMTGYANLRYYCRLYNIINYKERVDELLKLVELYDWRNQLVEKYSLGMKSKLALARALVHDPEILIVDEPTLGLDVKNSLFIRTFFKEMEKTIILTTHNLEVANDICSRITLLNKGKVLKIDTPESLKRDLFTKFIIEIESPEAQNLIKELKLLDFVENIEEIEKFKFKVHLTYKENIKKLLQYISEREIWDLKRIIPSLEDVFLKITSEN